MGRRSDSVVFSKVCGLLLLCPRPEKFSCLHAVSLFPFNFLPPFVFAFCPASFFFIASSRDEIPIYIHTYTTGSVRFPSCPHLFPLSCSIFPFISSSSPLLPFCSCVTKLGRSISSDSNILFLPLLLPLPFALSPSLTASHQNASAAGKKTAPSLLLLLLVLAALLPWHPRVGLLSYSYCYRCYR